MTNEQKLAQITEEMRHEQAMRRLQGDRLDSHDLSLAAIRATLDAVASRLDQTSMLVQQLTVSQAQTEAMLRDLIQAIAHDHSNGPQPEGGER
jgi:hypothetical protein